MEMDCANPRRAASASGGNQAHMASLIIGQLFAQGSLQRHLKEVLIPTYRNRYYTMVAAVRHYLYPLGIRMVTDPSGIKGAIEPSGGFFLYILFPGDESSPAIEDIHSLALAHFNLKIAPGSLFSVSEDKLEDESRPRTYVNGARLCWAWHEEDELVGGIERLAEAVKMAKLIRVCPT
jgi:DNA-binding transcriptional MocR family regulator